MDTPKADFNKEFKLRELRESDLDSNPFRQFQKWFEEALKADPVYANAMTLATANRGGKPSARMMLLKGFDEGGFVFYTNAESNKGEDLGQNPRAALVFWWSQLERQVRIEGRVEKVSDEEADSYFKTRPKGSQLGAWASQQSRVIRSRKVLDNRMEELEAKYSDVDVPRPPYWLGYRLAPESIEFWQGRPNRLHDRLRYRLVKDGSWIIERLAP
ncbi:MAG TPA: pyridoxamine 5'-phosphate oxidase [Thermodesulfobacteriota bacterium]|nr:pyridoxamine 5'-phosphate oxidase [Thermodesulfobacteriota bacterium]